MTITELQDPQAALVAPAAPAENFADELRWEAGILLGGLDWLFAQLTGRSAIAELVEPVAGDWAGLERGADAWRNAGRAAEAVAANYDAVTTSIGPGWQGEAADAFLARITSVADGFRDYGDGCASMAEVTDALLDLCQATAEALAGILGFIGDYLTRLVVEASIPVAGWVVGVVDGAVSGAMLVGKLQQGYRLLQRVLDFVERYRDVIRALERLATAVALLARAAQAAAHVQGVGLADDATSAAFGVAR